MFTTLYNIYMIYQLLLVTHGAYVAFGYLRWVCGYTYESIVWLMSFVYQPEVYPQLKDKKDQA